MSENPEDKSSSLEQHPGMQPNAPQLGRRLFVFKAAAVLSGVATAVVVAPTEVLARDVGGGHQDPEGSTHVYDVSNRWRRRRRASDNDDDDD